MTQAPTPGPLSSDASHIYRETSDASGRLAPNAPVEASGSERERLAKIVERLGPVMANNASPEQHADWLDLVRHVQALRPQPSGETREAVARIIDPGAWRDRDLFVSEDGYEDEMSASFVSPSFKKTDAILALLSARPLALGGQQGEEIDNDDDDYDDDPHSPCSVCGDEHPDGVLEDGCCPSCCDEEED